MEYRHAELNLRKEQVKFEDASSARTRRPSDAFPIFRFLLSLWHLYDLN